MLKTHDIHTICEKLQDAAAIAKYRNKATAETIEIDGLQFHIRVSPSPVSPAGAPAAAAPTPPPVPAPAAPPLAPGATAGDVSLAEARRIVAAAESLARNDGQDDFAPAENARETTDDPTIIIQTLDIAKNEWVEHSRTDNPFDANDTIIKLTNKGHQARGVNLVGRVVNRGI